MLLLLLLLLLTLLLGPLFPRLLTVLLLLLRLLCAFVTAFVTAVPDDPSASGSGTGFGSERTTSAAPNSRLATEARGASTQVSLEPPPWLELTTREPSTSATRVSPPGSTQTPSPSLTANGRRST